MTVSFSVVAGGVHRPVGVGVVGQQREVDRQDDVLADDVLVALVIRMDSDGTVAEHRLGPGCSDDQVAVARGKRVPEMPKVAGFVLREHFQIG